MLSTIIIVSLVVTLVFSVIGVWWNRISNISHSSSRQPLEKDMAPVWVRVLLWSAYGLFVVWLTYRLGFFDV